jgi:hypothetical protein
MKHHTVRGQIIQLLSFFTKPSHAKILKKTLQIKIYTEQQEPELTFKQDRVFGGLISTKIIKFEQFLAEKHDTKFQQYQLNSS